MLMACRILVPWSGIEPTLFVLEALGLNHWTGRGIPNSCLFCALLASMALSPSPSPPLLSHFRPVSSPRWIPTQAPWLSAILFSAVIKKQKWLSKTHVTLLPRAAHSILRTFRWLESFFRIVNVFLCRSQLLRVVVYSGTPWCLSMKEALTRPHIFSSPCWTGSCLNSQPVTWKGQGDFVVGKLRPRQGLGAASVPHMLFLLHWVSGTKSPVNVRGMDEFMSRSSLPGVTVNWW